MFLSVFDMDSHLKQNIRVAESEVKCSTPTLTFPKFPTPTPTSSSDSLTKREWSLAVNKFVAISYQRKSWCTAIILFQQKFQRFTYDWQCSSTSRYSQGPLAQAMLRYSQGPLQRQRFEMSSIWKLWFGTFFCLEEQQSVSAPSHLIAHMNVSVQNPGILLLDKHTSVTFLLKLLK